MTWRLFGLGRICSMLASLMLIVGAVRADQIDAIKLPALIEQSKPSVVLVGTFSATDSPRFVFRGTGFVVGSGNQAISNAHVLPENLAPEGGRQIALQVWVPPNLWSVRLAKVKAIDRARDLVLLSFDGPEVAPLHLAEISPREGSSVAFMGFPIGGALGFSHVTHRGLISSIAPMALPAATSQQLNSRVAAQLRSGSFDILQLDATAYPGNSGGPIFDLQTGHVVGVINSVLVKSNRESLLSQPSGISYGIPVEHARRLIQGAP